MKERTIIKNSIELSRNINKPLKPKFLSQFINITHTKSEILFGQKSFLQILLGLIKNTQVYYLSNNKSLENKNIEPKSLNSNNISFIKKILNDLKNSLKEIKIEKEKKLNLYKNIKDQRYINLERKIFSSIKSKRCVSNFNYINSNYETLVTENNENYFNEETPELKMLNFKIENEIIKLDNMIKRKLYIIKYYKTPHLLEDHQTEIICQDKKNIDAMDQFLHQQLIQKRNKFIEISNKKNLQNIRINKFGSQIIMYKSAIKDYEDPYKFIETKDIICEENCSYIETLNEEEKIKDNTKYSNNLEMGQDINLKENNTYNKNNINDLKNLELINMNDIEKLLNLNMNINVNINYNDKYINNYFEKNNNNKNKENCSSSNFSKKKSSENNFSNVDKKQ